LVGCWTGNAHGLTGCRRVALGQRTNSISPPDDE
jgi:hypothetical protein